MARAPGHEKKDTLTVKDLLAVAPEDTLGEVAEKMLARKTSTALVVDFGRIVGALSAREVLRAAAERAHPSEGRVREWMTAVTEGGENGARSAGPERDAAVCGLALETGSIEVCPEEACTFWWRGECVLAGLAGDIAEDPDRARFFLRMREKLGGAEDEGSLHGLPGLN